MNIYAMLKIGSATGNSLYRMVRRCAASATKSSLRRET